MSLIDTTGSSLMMGRVTPVWGVAKVVETPQKYSCCTEKDKQIMELKHEVRMLQDLLRNK